MSRTFTNKLYDMIDNGLLDKDTVIVACLKYMSEDDVKDMMEHNEFIEPEETWIIKDWANNVCFGGEEFTSFDEASDFLTAKMEELYPDTKTNEDRMNEELSEYEIEEK